MVETGPNNSMWPKGDWNIGRPTPNLGKFYKLAFQNAARFHEIFIPPLHRRWKGGILDSPWCLSVSPSVRLSVHVFPQLFAKTIGSIHFIPGIYTYGVSLWTPIDFRVRALIFGPLVAKNWPKIGVSATFRENCRLDSFHPWDLYLWGKSLDPYRFSCSCPHFWPSGGQKMTENRGFRNFSRKLSTRFISSLGFILMG